MRAGRAYPDERGELDAKGRLGRREGGVWGQLRATASRPSAAGQFEDEARGYLGNCPPVFRQPHLASLDSPAPYGTFDLFKSNPLDRGDPVQHRQQATWCHNSLIFSRSANPLSSFRFSLAHLANSSCDEVFASSALSASTCFLSARCCAAVRL